MTEYSVAFCIYSMKMKYIKVVVKENIYKKNGENKKKKR